MYDIYSIGDADYLRQILEGVSIMMSPAGPSGPGKMMAVALLLGVIITFVKGLISQKYEIHHIFTAFVIYAIIFLPRVDVKIHNVYTSNEYVVRDVPIGLAFTGELISTIGKTLTDGFALAFTQPDFPSMTDYESDPLKIITSFRDGTLGLASYGTSADDSNLKRSIQVYIEDCVTRDINLASGSTDPPNILINSVFRQSDLWQALRVNSAWPTKTYVTSAEVTTDCPSAHTEINNLLKSSSRQSKILRENAESKGFTGNDVQRTINILGRNTDNVTQMMTNVAITNLVRDTLSRVSAEGVLPGQNEAIASLTQSQASYQRDIKLASEKSLFAEIIRPLMAFIEAFFFVLAPFMAFMSLLGPMGLQIITAYAKIALIVQLWAPLGHVVNFFVYFKFDQAKDLAELAVQADSTINSGISSFALEQAANQAEHWLGVGGALYAAVPFLAFFIVSGSAQALQSLTGQITSKSNFDAKSQAPDITSTAGGNRTMGMTSTGANAEGLYMRNAQTGDSYAMPTFDIGAMKQNALTKAKENSATAKTITSQKGAKLSNSVSNLTNAYTQSGVEGISSSVSNEKSYKSIESQARSATEGITNQTQRKEATKAMAAIGLGELAKGIANGIPKEAIKKSIAGSVAGMLDAKGIAEGEQARSMAKSFANSIVSESKTLKTTGTEIGLTETIADSITNAFSEQNSKIESASQEYSEAKSNEVAATTRETALESATSSIGVGQKINGESVKHAFISQMREDGGHRDFSDGSVRDYMTKMAMNDAGKFLGVLEKTGRIGKGFADLIRPENHNMNDYISGGGGSSYNNSNAYGGNPGGYKASRNGGKWNLDSATAASYEKLEADNNLPKGYMAMTRRMENPSDDHAKWNFAHDKRPNYYTARGDFQFTRKTGRAMGLNVPDGAYPSARNDERTDPVKSAKAAARFAKQNAQKLRKANIPVNNTSLYIAHNQGAGGAAKIYKAAAQGRTIDKDSKLGKAMMVNFKTSNAQEFINRAGKKVRANLAKNNQASASGNSGDAESLNTGNGDDTGKSVQPSYMKMKKDKHKKAFNSKSAEKEHNKTNRAKNNKNRKQNQRKFRSTRAQLADGLALNSPKAAAEFQERVNNHKKFDGKFGTGEQGQTDIQTLNNMALESAKSEGLVTGSMFNAIKNSDTNRKTITGGENPFTSFIFGTGTSVNKTITEKARSQAYEQLAEEGAISDNRVLDGNFNIFGMGDPNKSDYEALSENDKKEVDTRAKEIVSNPNSKLRQNLEKTALSNVRQSILTNYTGQNSNSKLLAGVSSGGARISQSHLKGKHIDEDTYNSFLEEASLSGNITQEEADTLRQRPQQAVDKRIHELRGTGFSNSSKKK